MTLTRTILTALAFILSLLALGVTSAGASNVVAAAGDISCPRALEEEENAAEDLDTRPWKQLKCQGRRVAELIQSNGPDKVLALGDIVQGQKPTPRAFENFDDQWGAVRGLVRPTIGNHEYRRTNRGWNSQAYFDYWRDQGLDSNLIGKPERGWASWRIGKWHLINLNSNCFAIDCSIDGRQMRWLLAELRRYRENAATRCLAAYFHHPLFSAGIPRGRLRPNSLVGNFWSLLYLFGADLVINGHQHFYERYEPMDQMGRPDESGITQMISGTGGAFLFRTSFEDGTHLETSVARTSRFGATFFELGESGWESTFEDIRGDTFDPAAQTECHGKAASNSTRKELRENYRSKRGAIAELKRERKRLVRLVKPNRALSTPSVPPRRLSAKLLRVEKRLARERAVPLR